MLIIVAASVLLAGLLLWCALTAARLDRLATRVESARASLDAQLVRRAAAAQAIAATGTLEPRLCDRLRAAVRAAIEADDAGRESAENELGTVLRALPSGLDPDLMGDLVDAGQRVVLARRFYNDAVRDTRALRAARISRLVVRGGRRPVPAFFEIADAVEPAQTAQTAQTPQPAQPVEPARPAQEPAPVGAPREP